jgi:hypothetical protein
MSSSRLPSIAFALGLAGLIPQAGVLAVVQWGDSGSLFPFVVFGFAYPALILSFLGGVWWGLAARAPSPAPVWIWVAAVAPSLISLAATAPLAFGAGWPLVSLSVVGGCLILSPLIDLLLVRLGMCPEGWLRLRVPLSVGLGGLTLLLAIS